jgi:hypothetical protein
MNAVEQRRSEAHIAEKRSLAPEERNVPHPETFRSSGASNPFNA